MSDNVLSGKRVWNDTLGTTALAKTNIPFISGGGQYAAFSYNVTGTPPLVTQKTLAYYPENSDLGIIAYSMSAGSDSGWNNKYKVFEFVSPVSVDDDLYNFVMNNSTPVIELSSPSGIVLETKGTYCDEDIMVMPSDSENIIAENIKNGVQILGVTGNYAPETSGGVKLNVIYSETEPTDTTKRWVKCTEPSKVTIDENQRWDSAGINEPTSEKLGFATSNSNYVYIYNGVRYASALSSNTSSVINDVIRTYLKDSNVYTTTTLTPTFSIYQNGYGSQTCTMLQYKDQYRVVCLFGNSSASGVYPRHRYQLQFYDLAAGSSVILESHNSSTYDGYCYPIAVTSDAVYYYYRYYTSSSSQTYRLIKYDIATGVKTTLGNSDDYAIASQCFYYNNKLYYFASTTSMRVFDISTKTFETKKISADLSDEQYYYQIDNKLYYYFNGVLKYFDLDTFEAVTVKTLTGASFSGNAYIGSYDDDTLLICDTTGGQKVTFYYSVNSGELLLRTTPADYDLISDSALVYKAEPATAFWGDSENKGEQVECFRYDTDLSRWVWTENVPLAKPTTSLSGDMLTITAVTNATKYIVYKDGVQLTETTSLTVDLSQFITDYGTYSITVEAGCDIGYLNSLESTAVNYTIEAPTITYNLTGCTGSDNNPTTLENKIYELNFTANIGYELPTSITATNCELVSWDAENGVAEIRNFTGDVVVTVTATLINYSVTYNLTGCAGESTNPVSVQAENSYSLVFTASDGYELPDSITVNGATLNSWDKSTGIAIINSVISNVTITIISDTIPASALVTDNDDGTVDIVIEELTANAENATITENQDSTVDIAITNL